jgi:hypothetical protein
MSAARLGKAVGNIKSGIIGLGIGSGIIGTGNMRIVVASVLAALFLTIPLHPRTTANQPAVSRTDSGAGPADPAEAAGNLSARSQLGPQPRPGQQFVTGLRDQTDLSVTVYNSDLALVRDVRDIALPAGTVQLKFMDIASTINPATVHFRSLADPTRISVLEQNYEYDLLEPAKLLTKYVGREVTLLRPRQVNGNSEMEEVRATLIADNNGPVWKIGNEIVTGFNPAGIRFPDLPDNLYDRPTLLWTLANRGADKQKVEASYLARSLSWSSDYVLTVSREETSADLDGWVTLVNNSGASFQNARLQLVAGELNRVRDEVAAKAMMAGALREANAEPAPFQQEAFSEYHLYTLGRRTSISDKESKQISLLNASGVPISKVYEVDGQSYYFRSAMRPGAPTRDPVQIYYKFKNEAKGSLGMPLPSGTVRVYEADSQGNVLFAGEDHIGHTPKDEEVSLHVGNTFDVVADRKQTDYKEVSPRVREMEYEITLRNHKTIPVTVEVNEPIGGDWEMISANQQWTKTAAFAAQFTVPVAKDGTTVLRYRVRVR